MKTQTLNTIKFGDNPEIFVGQEATVSYGSDSYPGKVKEIRRVAGGYELDIMEYGVKATDKGKAIGIGHQEWEILWDQPKSVTTVRLRLNGDLKKNQSFSYVFMGHARYYYCWEF